MKYSKTEMEELEGFKQYDGVQFSEEEILHRSRSFLKWADQRRSIRCFSDKEVPLEIMENLIMTGSTAPSGAHKQPWTFCLISNKELKNKLRMLAEEEEYKSYN